MSIGPDTGPKFETELVLAGDERSLQAHATLVRNAAAAGISRTAAERRRLGLGQIPRIWEPGR